MLVVWGAGEFDAVANAQGCEEDGHEGDRYTEQEKAHHEPQAEQLAARRHRLGGAWAAAGPLERGPQQGGAQEEEESTGCERGDGDWVAFAV